MKAGVIFILPTTVLQLHYFTTIINTYLIEECMFKYTFNLNVQIDSEIEQVSEFCLSGSFLT